MADRRIADYIRQNMGNYPVEVLKKACLDNGFAPQEVEEAAREVLSGCAALPAAPPPAPPRKKDLRKKLLVVLGVVGGLLASAALCVYVLVSKVRKVLPDMSAGGSITVQSGAGFQDMDPDAALQTASKMMQALGDEETNAKFQATMRRAQEDPMSVIRDMQKYQDMAYPPKETLLLLDTKTSSLLVTEWPNLSGPVRKSLIETLPTTPKEDRADAVLEIMESSRGVNEMIGQSMQMLNEVIKQMPQDEPMPEPAR